MRVLRDNILLCSLIARRGGWKGAPGSGLELGSFFLGVFSSRRHSERRIQVPSWKRRGGEGRGERKKENGDFRGGLGEKKRKREEKKVIVKINM